ncbi:MAG TPA: hypothetical protein VF376_04005 [Thermoanaerobaculia bacterium]
MTTKKKASAGKKLKLKKETIKDLDVKGKAKDVKGGSMLQCQKPTHLNARP